MAFYRFLVLMVVTLGFSHVADSQETSDKLPLLKIREINIDYSKNLPASIQIAPNKYCFKNKLGTSQFGQNYRLKKNKILFIYTNSDREYPAAYSILKLRKSLHKVRTSVPRVLGKILRSERKTKDLIATYKATKVACKLRLEPPTPTLTPTPTIPPLDASPTPTTALPLPPTDTFTVNIGAILGGSLLPDVTWSISSSVGELTLVDDYISLPGIPRGTSYTITPTKTGYQFIPSSRTGIVTGDLGLGFEANPIMPSPTPTQPTTPTPTPTQPPSTTRQIKRNDLFETIVVVPYPLPATLPPTLTDQQALDDVSFQTTFTLPDGVTQIVLDGFYNGRFNTNGSPSEAHWVIRFVPYVLGTYNYTWRWRHIPTGIEATGTGDFQSTASTNLGPLRVNPTNVSRLQFQGTGTANAPNGPAYFATGFNIDWGDDGGDQDGAFGDWRGAMGEPHDVMSKFIHAGFKLIRFKNAGMGEKITSDTTLSTSTYNFEILRRFDERMKHAKSMGAQIVYGIFGNALPGGQTAFTTSQQKLIKYSLARFGAFVDIWQISNEKVQPISWLDQVVNYTRGTNTYQYYKQIIGESWESNASSLTSSQLSARMPHTYRSGVGPGAFNDMDFWLRTQSPSSFSSLPLLQYNQPVIWGEFGNLGSNWDSDSLVRTTLRSWATLLRGGYAVYFPQNLMTDWNTGAVANVYLGIAERNLNQILVNFGKAILKPDSSVFNATTNNAAVNAFGITSAGTNIAILINHWNEHTTSIVGGTVNFISSIAATGTWMDPTTGEIRGTTPITSGINTIAIPTFQKFLVLYASSAPIDFSPFALYHISNPQMDGDLDNDGRIDIGPTNTYFGHQPFGKPTLTLTFNAALSRDLDGGAITYSWDFGDGTTSTSSNPTHTYAFGTYNTRLTVTDNEGNTSSQEFTVRAVAATSTTNRAPKYTTIRPITVRQGEAVHLEPVALDPEQPFGVGTAYQMLGVTHFISGAPTNSVFNSSTSSGSPSFDWTPSFGQSPGTYTVTFRARDPLGAEGSLAVPITVVAGNAE